MHLDTSEEYAQYGEMLEHSRERIDAYRALASPVYMCIKQSDPILAAFELGNLTSELAELDPIFNVSTPFKLYV